MPDNIFGIPVRYESWDKQNRIPLYIAGGYDFVQHIFQTSAALC